MSTLEGDIFYSNNAAPALLGFDAAQPWLRTLSEFAGTFELATIDGRVLAFEEWPLARVIAGEPLRNLHVILRRTDIDWEVILKFSGDLVVEDGGNTFALLSFANVTERRRYEIELQQANERFAIASEAAGLGFWDFDIASNALRWDDRMFAIYGRPKSGGERRGDERLQPLEHNRHLGEQAYALWSDSLHPEDRERSKRELLEAIEGTRDFHTTYRIIRPNGEIRHLKSSARATRDSEGRPVSVVGVCVDITEREWAENALRDGEQRYRFLAEAMSQIVWTAKSDGNKDYFNQQTFDYTGLTFEQAKDWGWTRALHPDDLEYSINRWTHSVTTGSDFEVEYRLQHAATGTYRWHLVRAFPLRDRHGAIGQWVGTCTDIHDQKRAEETLRDAYDTLEQRVSERTAELRAAKAEADKANAAKSEFLANMSHEIRTPLNAVIGLGFLLEQTCLTEDQHDFLSKIRFAGRSLLNVVNNVLDLSKIEAGEVSLEDQSFDLPELLQNTAQMLASQATAKGIRLIVHPADDLPRQVSGDATRLGQILINLLNNAIKFTDVGQVELVAHCTERGRGRIRLRCEVIDTGIGIAPAAIKRIFAPFSQADASTTRRFGGTGLGLSIARHLIDLMGGEIDVSSTVGVGSKFWFEVPLGLEHSAATSITARGLRITLVESGGPGSVAGMLRAFGWSPHVVSTGEELLSFLDDAEPGKWPHLLIAPLQLADMDVHQLIACLDKASTRDDMPPVIALADGEQSYLAHQPRMQDPHVMLALPLTSSAMFNAVNAAVSTRPEGREHMLQFTESDVLRTQWLIGVRLLVVDDSALNREVAQGILKSQGAIVSTCSDGRKAVEHVRAHHQQLDAVLMDVQMPVMDGNEATQLIRGELKLPNLPIIALTAGALANERQRALRAGMNDIVTKPFDPQVLIRKLRYFVERSRGEPISVALFDRERVLRPANGPLIPSINPGVVQQMFGEDTRLFKSALSRMLRDYGEFAAPISASLDDRDARSLLKARVHELKGSAGLIGATGIMRLANSAETALEQGRSSDILAPMLGQLTEAFSALCDEGLFWLASEAEREGESEATVLPGQTVDAADLEEMYALLDSRNLAVLDKFSSMSPSLRELLGAKRFDSLRDAVDNLDFSLGAQLLREYCSTLRCLDQQARA